MTREELRVFMEERLLELDPTLSTSLNSDMYAKVINPLLTRLRTEDIDIDTESFILARLRDEFPSLDVSSPASALKDMLVTPLSMLLDPVKSEIQFAKTQKSLNNLDALTEEEVDALLANVLIERNLGAYAFTTLKLYFNNPRELGLDRTITFSTADGISFTPRYSTKVLPKDMVPAGNLYSIDVEVRSVEPLSEANVEKNTIKYVNGLTDVVRVTNPYKATGGVSKEVNTEAYARATRSLSERSLNTQRGIETELLNSYGGLLSVEVVGFGDAEMQRDILRATITSDPDPVGALVYSTTNWKTLPVVGMSTAVIPFTNALVLKPMYDGANYYWPTELYDAIMASKYVRVTDGSNMQWPLAGIKGAEPTYDPKLLGRIREINRIEFDTVTSDIKIQLKDFTLYPQDSGAVFLPTPAVQVSTESVYCGLNKHPIQGSAYRLYVEEGGVERLLGAPLMCTETVYTDSFDGPLSAVPGQDFLVTFSTATFATDASSTPIGIETPCKMGCYPVTKVYSSSELQVGRMDGFLTSKSRLYSLTGSPEFKADLPYALMNERLRVISFGGPIVSGVEAPLKFSGATEEFGRNGAAKVYGGVDPVVTVDVYINICDGTYPSSGQYLCLALFDYSTFTGDISDINSAIKWQDTGKIKSVTVEASSSPYVCYKLVVEGLDVGGIDEVAPTNWDLATHTFTEVPPEGVWRFFWTLYDGVTSAVMPDGSVVRQTADSVYPPSSKIGRATANVRTRTYSGYIDDRWLTGQEELTSRGIYWIDGPDGVTDNEMYGVVIRLDTPFTEVPLGMDVASSEACTAILPVVLSQASTGEHGGSTPTDYLVAKSENVDDINIDDTGAPTDTVSTVFVSLPVVEGSRKSDVSTVAYDTLGFTPDLYKRMSYANPKGLAGFLLPHPMGRASYDELVGTAIESNDLLEGQAVSLFLEKETVASGDSTLTVSGVPGSLPFPGTFGGSYEINNNEVHIGGMTDVYVKPASTQTSTTGAITITPDDITDTSKGVALVSNDGAIDGASPSIFYSDALVAKIQELKGGNADERYIGDLSVIITPPTDSIALTSFRLLTMVSGGVRIDGEFTIDPADRFENVKFILLMYCHVDLFEPKIVLQQGADLVMVRNNQYVSSPTGFNDLGVDVTAVSTYLSIDSGDSYGEYKITEVNNDTLYLSATVPVSGTGESYRVYTKQPYSVSRPLVRVTRVSVSSDEYDVEIPYMHPVSSRASDFSGYNNDPITDETIGVDLAVSPTLRDVSYSGTSAALIVSDTEDFVADYSMTTNCAVSFPLLADDIRYWYITGFGHLDNADYLTGTPDLTPGLTQNVAILDRSFGESPRTDVSFVMGQPAVGSATLYFKDPTTYAVFSATTTFEYTDAAGTSRKFRPSQLEYATVFEHTNNQTTFTFHDDAGVNKAYITCGDTDIYKYGASAGGYVDVISRVLVSGDFTGVDDAIEIAGKTLTVVVDDVPQYVVFTGSNPYTLQHVADNINSRLREYLYADISTTGGIFLRVSSTHEIELSDSSSYGILDTLKYPLANRVNTSFSGSSELIGRFKIDSLEHTGSESVIHLYSDLALEIEEPVLIRVVSNEGVQVIFPADMIESGPLYSASVTLVSMDPNIPGGLISDGQELTVGGGYLSFGYEFVVKNNCYSYSDGEETDIRITSQLLPKTATSLGESINIAGYQVTIDYDYSDLVSTLQNYMLSRHSRVLCNNPLVRHMLPAYPMFDIAGYGTNVSTKDIKSVVSSFMAERYPNKDVTVYELLAALSKKGVTSVTLPQEVAFLTHDKDRVLSLVSSNNIVSLGRGCHIMEDVSGVTVNGQ